MQYSMALKGILSTQEKRIFEKLDSPQKIQDHIDTLPINFETSGETYMSPRRVIRERTAHCFEGALFAAAALAYHGKKPLLLDLRTAPHDEDHVVALFEENSHWGAISKTNHVVLRFRDPVYSTVRELVMSYFHEYALSDGSKNLRAYSDPIDLSEYHPAEWVTAEEELFSLVDRCDSCRHYPVAPQKNLKNLRATNRIERKILYLTEWDERGRKKRF